MYLSVRNKMVTLTASDVDNFEDDVETRRLSHEKPAG